MAEWQSIETAPRDGTPVLLFLPDGNRGLSGCKVGEWWGCWWTNGGPNAGRDMDGWDSATHWMPLPEPPETDK